MHPDWLTTYDYLQALRPPAFRRCHRF